MLLLDQECIPPVSPNKVKIIQFFKLPMLYSVTQLDNSP